MIKLAAFDVDGTLRDRDFLPESTRTALRKLKEHGVVLTLCTGRSEFEMGSLRSELGIDWAITCNGSHIGYRGETVMGTPFDRGVVAQWVRTADRRKHAIFLYGASGMYINRADSPCFLQAREEIGFLEPLPMPSAEEIPAIYQCILFVDEREQEAYIGNNGQGYYLHRWRPWALDINPGGANKAVGLQRLMNRLGIAPEETAAFGDGLNDLEMLSAAGLGIVMGNAEDNVKANGTHVTKSLHEDGILHAVNRWILPFGNR